MKRLVIGITAHVDAGKTTLAEAILYRTGEIRKLGRVDHRDAFLDTHPMERDRGITIFSKQAGFSYGDAHYTLLDTPGHVDFAAETERTMQVLDYAILVISGTDGVQSHTETIWRLLRRYGVPTFLFVNKMDLAGANKDVRLSQLRSRFGDRVVDFSDDDSDTFYEQLALLDEDWMNRYLDTGMIPQEDIRQKIAACGLVPCYFGSALRLKGVDAFLEGLDRYTIEPQVHPTFGARVYKIHTDEKGARLTNLKVTGGVLRVRDMVSYTAEDGALMQEKVNQIRIYDGARFQGVEQAEPGMICAVTGLTRTYAGAGLGAEPNAAPPLLEPVLHYGVILPDGIDPHTAWEKLRTLEQEDPALHMLWDEVHGQIRVQLMGEVQLEVLEKLIQERFSLTVSFDDGQISYRETIAAPVEGVGHYEPLRHYAEVHLILTPLPPGSGLQFDSICREDDLDRNWQRLVLTHLAEKIHVGVLTGSPITDMRITLCAGRAHKKHTEGGDFRQATYRAVRNGLRKAESILLEPWYDFTLEVPTHCVGRAMTDLQQMHAKTASPITDGDQTMLTGSVPVAAIAGYAKDVAGYTKGVGRLSCVQKGYAPCENAAAVIKSIGYDCDSDLENTADSIFCGHGAGFHVSWDEVEQYMHLPLTLQKRTAPDDDASANPSASHRIDRASYGGSIEEDKELMEIFERTYGKIDRDPRRAMNTPRDEIEPAEPARPIVPVDLNRTEYVLVDGYNMIFAWDELKAIAAENLDAARGRLMQILSNYCGYRQCRLILVFDAYRVKGQRREVEQYHNISVVYTKEAETADSYIEKISHELSKENRVRVATSDAMEQMIILGNGALRVPAEEFRQEVKQTEAAIREYASRQKLGKKTIREKRR